jgi:3-methylcrotonyl-CoA carboxylase alpha subunit
MQYSYDYNDQTYTIDLKRQPDGTYRAQIGEREYTVTATQLADGDWLIRTADTRQIAHVARDDPARYVQIAGVQYQLAQADNRQRRGASQASSGDLTAEMPGQVLDVRVAIGDTVAAGTVLVVLEAMKMEIRITAPQDGTVATLHVSAGDVVERGQVLVELDT